MVHFAIPDDCQVHPQLELENCKKQKFVNKNLYSHFKDLYWLGCVKNDEIYIKILNLFQLSRIYNLLQNSKSVQCSWNSGSAIK